MVGAAYAFVRTLLAWEKACRALWTIRKMMNAAVAADTIRRT